jgi:hypothetical protein
VLVDNSHRHLIESLDLSDDDEVNSFLRYVKSYRLYFLLHSNFSSYGGTFDDDSKGDKVGESRITEQPVDDGLASYR